MPTAMKHVSTFRSETSVAVTIAAPPAKVWALLTDAAAFPRWNSTVTSIEGTIAAGHKLALRVPASPRTFKPKVVAFEPATRMVWTEGAAPMFKGVRTFTLAPDGAGTRFAMTEVLTGLMLPLAKKSLPDFAPIFETYAADLKVAAEK